MKTSILIPCYWANRKLLDMTLECIKSLQATQTPDQIIVVDDGSPLLSHIGAYGLPQDIEIVELKENEGYAAAVNAGLKKATGDILIICNNDIVFVQPDWLDQLLLPLDEGYDISSIRTTDADGWDTEERIEDGAKFGSIWAMKRKVYATVGPLDESFGKGYFEDLDFQKRAEDAGFKVGKNHAGIVEHLGKATFKETDPDDTAYRKAGELFRKKWGSIW